MNRNQPESAGQFDWKLFCKSLAQGIGSLRVTVFLLILGLFLVWIATMQQTRRDIYQVKQQHFRSPIVDIEFQELIPPAWFPELQDVGGVFLLPSGATILFAMLINLLFAHATRFRVKARGKTLIIGSLFLGFGFLTTLLVIMNGNARGQFQEEPLIDWQTQWNLLQALLGLAAVAGMVGASVYHSKVRRIFSFVAGLILAGCLAFFLYQGESAFIGNDAMRVIWRLAQGSVAAIIVYIGAVMVFDRKAGIVVIHTGLLLLMIGELYTTYSAVEQRLFFFEGDTTSHTVDVNEVEMAVFESPEENDRQNVIAIPHRRLDENRPIKSDELPFEIETIAYFPNSRLYNIQPGEQTVPNAKGIARFVFAEQIDPVPGTDGNNINSASAYVRLTDPVSKKDLGTWLIAQKLYRDDAYDLDTVTVNGKDWQIGLRFKHFYKPYQVTLNSTTRTDYTGTMIPQSYSSNFRIVDAKNNVDEVKEVSMNNPLRYNNETFYQSGHDTDPVTGRKYSVMQVVRNTGWMIPYVCCSMVGIGLILHFLGTFVTFVERLSKSRIARSGYDKVSLAFVLGFVLLFAMYAWREVPKPVVVNDFDLEEFGQIPVAYGGRVQPLDSIARSTLRQLRKYEIPVKWDRETQKEIEYPPVQWLADWVFAAEESDTYRIFKIDDPGVLQALSLIRRKSHLYSFRELEEVKTELDRYVDPARKLQEANKAALTPLQKKLIKLDDNIERVRTLRYAFGSPENFGFEDPIQTLELIMSASRTPNQVPMAVPGESEDSWSVLSPLMTGHWIRKLCDDYETSNVDQVATLMVEAASREQFEEILLKRELGRSLVQLSEMDPRSVDEAQLDKLVDDLVNSSDPEIQARVESLTKIVQPRVDALVDVQVDAMADQVAEELAKLVPNEDGEFVFRDASLSTLSLLQDAYSDGDADTFNSAVSTHLSEVADYADVADNRGKVQCESLLNRLSPFYLATAIYIGAFLLSLLSWLFLTGSSTSMRMASLAVAARRASFWLVVLAFALHTAGLLMRIYVSGRPPVTNLYGSAVFIGWVAVLFGLITERMIGFCFGNIKSSFAGVTSLLTAFALGAEGDTFSVLQAVLDTQFWLSTHVVSISIGYAATLIAGLLGILYLATSILVPLDLQDIRKILAKMVYGVTCLALIFSFVGTVLGGLWADDSWGRFWGWDPKENGALMIVLVNAILLHARWAGLVKDRGMAVIAVGGNIVTLWSWFAVNELGIGLHTYGLTEGRMKVVGLAWLAHLGIMLAAWVPQKFWLSNLVNRQPATEVAEGQGKPGMKGKSG